ncbi:MAG: septum formation protein Maf [Clostridia bacterium]|nr:septum formation protein Maf [Clostridia bacterium]
MSASLILASNSPRRRELLSLLGISFQVDAPEVDETTSLPASQAVHELSIRKAKAAAALHPGAYILAADTLVALDERPFGKPEDTEDAFRMLRSLSGQTHHVHTGVCVISPEGFIHTGTDSSSVRFGEMTDGEIRWYISTGEPMDKAGAYALQGLAGMWVEEVRGTPSGVIGLPLPLTRELLQQAGFPLPFV